MKFVLFALVLLSALSASVSHGLAAAPHCGLSYGAEETRSTAGDSIRLAVEADVDVRYSLDGSHCAFNALIPSDDRVSMRVGLCDDRRPFPTPPLEGRGRLPDERPPSLHKA